MTLGFIGTGTITAALITGLCTAVPAPERVLVSPRNASRAADLAGAFPQVAVAPDNQAVVDGSEWVFLALRPQVAREGLAPLRFRAGQHVVSLIPTLSLADLASVVAPATNVVRAVPLPTVAHHSGPIAMCPPDVEVASLFARVGVPVEVTTEAHFRALWAVTGLIAPYMALLGHTARWVAARGVAAPTAQRYTSALFHCVAEVAKEAVEGSFEALAAEAATPGGLNERALSRLTAARWYEALAEALDGALAFLEGRPVGTGGPPEQAG